MTRSLRHRATAAANACAFAFVLGLASFAAPAHAVPPSLLVTPIEGDAANGLATALQRALESVDGLELARGVEALAEATPADVRAAAENSGADAVLLGRLVEGVAHLELRSGHSGGRIADWQLAADGSGADRLAREVGLVLAANAAVPEGAVTVGGVDVAIDDDAVLGDLRSDGPISIRSDQLDVASRDGERHLVFRRNVRVEQGDIELRTSKLDAFYAHGESEPRRLVAHGDVQVIQGDRVARCDSATYLRSENKVVCSGRAHLVQGCDVVRGDQLEFDLDREHFRVTGAASVVLGEEGDCVAGEGGGRS